MSNERDATLRQAERLLRQGRLVEAIAEYVRLVEEQPADWNTINALGDLYARAGQADRAVEQFTRVADHLTREGFYSRAAALYKKALRIHPNDTGTLLRLVDLAMRQGLLVDAKAYLREAAEQRHRRGDERGAAEMIVRLGSVDPDDAESKVAAARAAHDLGDRRRAAALLKDAAATYRKQHRHAEASEAMGHALDVDPSAAGDDPQLLLILARRELHTGRLEEGRAALMRLLSSSPDRRWDAIDIGRSLAGQGKIDAAFVCVDLVADLALLGHDLPSAAAALEAFVEHVPDHLRALVKLAAICVDGQLNELMTATERRLADAYLAAGRAADARAVAERLVGREPSAQANLERLRRALVLLGEGDPDAVIAAHVRGDRPSETPAGIAPATPHAGPSAQTHQPSFASEPDPAATGRVADEPTAIQEDDDVIVLEAAEIDLSDALSRLDTEPEWAAPPPDRAAPAAPAAAVPDLEAVFEDLRAKVASRPEAKSQYDAAMAHLSAGRLDEAIAAFEDAAGAPMLRFEASAQLGRLYARLGQWGRAAEWLGRAAEAPAPAPHEGHAVMSELVDALEWLGDRARALVIARQLQAEAPGFGDVAARVERLSRVQSGS